MVCAKPSQAYVRFNADGTKDLRFCKSLNELFRRGLPLPADVISLNCGQCMPCRLEKSRQVALRCVHESRLYEHNCFITLTYSDEFLQSMCPLKEGGYSLVRKHVSDFVKRLRIRFARGFDHVYRDGKKVFVQFDRIRVFGCGEYGDKTARPHYHLILFNCYFPDRELIGRRNGFLYYRSRLLKDLWPFGNNIVCDFSFETAAYVSRYQTKKVTGKMAEGHYKGRLPEFAIYPTSGGGLGRDWFDKYSVSDVIPTDSCIARYVKCSVPKYYDKLWEKFDPVSFWHAKQARVKRAVAHEDDNSFLRRQDKLRCTEAKMKLYSKRSLD